jgi:glucuronate isomerase
MLNDDRLFPADPTTRALARQLFDAIRALPLISPHGHTEPRWYAENAAFPDPAQLLVVPDHYVTRMLVSQGVSLESLGVPRRDGGAVETDGRTIWRRFAEHYYLFRGTPTRLWLDTTLSTLFGISELLGPKSADRIYDIIAGALETAAFRPRALYERFNL